MTRSPALAPAPLDWSVATLVKKYATQMMILSIGTSNAEKPVVVVVN